MLIHVKIYRESLPQLQEQGGQCWSPLQEQSSSTAADGPSTEGSSSPWQARPANPSTAPAGGEKGTGRRGGGEKLEGQEHYYSSKHYIIWIVW